MENQIKPLEKDQYLKIITQIHSMLGNVPLTRADHAVLEAAIQHLQLAVEELTVLRLTKTELVKAVEIFKAEIADLKGEIINSSVENVLISSHTPIKIQESASL